jgi:hypothetical protein
MTESIQDWVVAARQRTAMRLDLGKWEKLPWRRGLWITALSDYRPLPLPSDFSIHHIRVPGGYRRIAFRSGKGRPLVILPGSYAALDEGLFSALASTSLSLSRPVAVLEDRLAAPTLRLMTGRLASVAQQGQEAACIAKQWSEVPDVLALSAGVSVALAAPDGCWHRLVGWSSVIDPRHAFERVAKQKVLRWYFGRVHQAAFERAGLRPPPLMRVLSILEGDGIPRSTTCQSLFVHAADDPVAPVEPVAARSDSALVTRWGGHLGFSAISGAKVYLTPFEERS